MNQYFQSQTPHGNTFGGSEIDNLKFTTHNLTKELIEMKTQKTSGLLTSGNLIGLFL